LNIYKFGQKECFTTSLKLGAKVGADENEGLESPSFPRFLIELSTPKGERCHPPNLESHFFQMSGWSRGREKCN
jgi:hypothetical protein